MSEYLFSFTWYPVMTLEGILIAFAGGQWIGLGLLVVLFSVQSRRA